jgi:membrane protein YqaA with SNARE-associated domain
VRACELRKNVSITREGPCMLSRLYAALHRWAESGWAGTATATWEVLQGSVVPGPSGAIFAPLVVADPERGPRLACWAAAGAFAGGCIAYLIGAQAFETVGRTVVTTLGVSEATLASSAGMFERHGWLIVFIATISPLSTKLTCIAAGAFPTDQARTVSFAVVTAVQAVRQFASPREPR